MKALRPYQIVSLWDMMRINAYTFVAISEKLEEMQFGADMCSIERDELPDELRRTFHENLGHILRHCKELELDVTAALVQRMLVTYENQCNCKAFHQDAKALLDRFKDEIAAFLFIHIPKHKADFALKKDLFGSKVTDKFPSATFDIEEAGSSFAFRRHTACVFHLLRAVEIGVKAFASGLGVLSKIKTPQPNWGEVLRETWKEIQDRNKAADPTWTADKRSYFENMQTDLQMVKTAWRNPTMHVENIYDEERAEDIFNAVKTFMRHMADHLDESGQFTP